MNNLFQKTKLPAHSPSNIEINMSNTSKYGKRSVKHLGLDMLNSLSEQEKKQTSLGKFKEFINQRFGPKCKCKIIIFVTGIQITKNHFSSLFKPKI